MALNNTIIGGGTFTGKAVYDNLVFDTNIAEDVSEIVSMVSPYETPLLTLIGDSDVAAKNVFHEWLEDELSPNSFKFTAGGTNAVTTITPDSGMSSYIQVGAVLRNPATNEYMQVTAVTGADLTVTRGAFGTTAAVIAANATIEIINDAAVEGADVQEDTSRARTRQGNHTMIFKKDVIVSGTTRNVNMLGGIADELDYQVQKKTRENLRDLEKAVILSRKDTGQAAGNLIGSASATRTFQGLLQYLESYNHNVTLTVANATNTSTGSGATADAINGVVKGAWEAGGSDIDTIVCGTQWKEIIDQLNNTTVRTVNDESKYRRLTTVFEGTYGEQQVVLSRWMPSDTAIFIARPRIKIVPLSGRSFSFVPVAKTGDSDKGMIIGEYTVEVRNKYAMGYLKLTP
jgi:hypothetical protein